MYGKGTSTPGGPRVAVARSRVDPHVLQTLHAWAGLLGVSWPDRFWGKAALAQVGKQVADKTGGRLFFKSRKNRAEVCKCRLAAGSPWSGLLL